MKIAIYGYGNLGKGVECALKYNEDTELVGIFTRRPPESVTPVFSTSAVYSAEDIFKFKDEIDVVIICGGSATDLPKMTPTLAESFNVIDSFDTHAAIPEHFNRVNSAAEKSSHLALICAGWDPGLFSIARLYSSAVLPNGNDYTFWGRGVSQGHSDAIRRIDGVLDARQYTVPIDEALQKVRNGENPILSTADKHIRECYVVLKDGADREKIEKEIKSMPNYFADYHTIVNFISIEELREKHMGIPHGGTVIRNGITGKAGENNHTVEFSLKLDSNPEFTASVLVCAARAVNRMSKRGRCGCITLFDVAPGDLSIKTAEELRAHML